MQKTLYLYLLLVLFTYSRNIHAECNLSFNGLATNQSITIDADTINSNTETQTLNFNIENTGTSACYYFVTINEGLYGDFNFNRQAKITHAFPAIFQNADLDKISYQLYSQSITSNNILKSLDEAVFDQNVIGPNQILPGQTLSDNFLIHVPSQKLPNLIAESYEDNVVLTLYKSNSLPIDYVNDCPTCIQENQQTLSIQFKITDYITLSIGNSYNPSSKQAFVDFGDLVSNDKEDFQIYVGGRIGSSGSCSVTISSENGSRLVRESVTGTPKDYDIVKYQIQATPNIGSPNVPSTIDVSSPNTPVSLGQSSTLFVCGNNNQALMSIIVSIILDTVEKKVSGPYRDTLTIDVTIGL